MAASDALLKRNGFALNHDSTYGIAEFRRFFRRRIYGKVRDSSNGGIIIDTTIVSAGWNERPTAQTKQRNQQDKRAHKPWVVHGAQIFRVALLIVGVLDSHERPLVTELDAVCVLDGH